MPGTLHDLQAKFENYTTLTASRATSTRYARALSLFFSRFTEKPEPEDFTRVDVEDYRLWRIRDKVQPSTINYEIQVVRAFWNWLLRMEAASYNPASLVKRLKETEPERKSLTEAEQIRMYETSRLTGTPLDAVLVALALSTGQRAETLVQLEKVDVDFEELALRIPAAKMKARKNHEIPLRPDVVELLRPLPEGRIFEGYAHDAKSLSYRFDKLCKRSGVSLRGLRTARRSFATGLLRSGADLRMVQDLMPHQNISTTSRYLTSADSKQVRAALDKLPLPPGPNPSTSC